MGAACLCHGQWCWCSTRVRDCSDLQVCQRVQAASTVGYVRGVAVQCSCQPVRVPGFLFSKCWMVLALAHCGCLCLIFFFASRSSELFPRSAVHGPRILASELGWTVGTDGRGWGEREDAGPAARTWASRSAPVRRRIGGFFFFIFKKIKISKIYVRFGKFQKYIPVALWGDDRAQM